MRNSGTDDLAKNGTLILLSLLISGVISLGISVTVSRIVGVQEFGIYSLVGSIQSVVSVFAGFGIGIALSKYIAQYYSDDKDEALRFAKAGLLLAVIFMSASSVAYFALAKFIGQGIYHEQRLVDLIAFSSLFVVGNSIYALAFGIAQGCQRIGILALMRLVSSAVSVGAVFPLTIWFGTEGALTGLFLAQAITGFIVLGQMKRRGFSFLRASLDERRDIIVGRLLRFATPSVLSALVVLPILWLGNSILIANSGVDAVAYFAVAMVFFGLIIIIPQAVSIPLVPRISEYSASDNRRIERTVNKTMRVIAVLLFPIVLGTGLFSQRVIVNLYGPSFAPAGISTYLMLGAGYFSALAAVIGALITGIGRMWVGLGLNILWSAILVILALTLVPSYSQDGLAAAFMVSYGIHFVASLTIARSKFHMSLRPHLATIVAAIAFLSFGMLVAITVSETNWIVRGGLFSFGTISILASDLETSRYLTGKAKIALRSFLCKTNFIVEEK